MMQKYLLSVEASSMEYLEQSKTQQGHLLLLSTEKTPLFHVAASLGFLIFFAFLHSIDKKEGKQRVF